MSSIDDINWFKPNVSFSKGMLYIFQSVGVNFQKIAEQLKTMECETLQYLEIISWRFGYRPKYQPETPLSAREL